MDKATQTIESDLGNLTAQPALAQSNPYALRTYIFRGREGESVHKLVEKLIVKVDKNRRVQAIYGLRGRHRLMHVIINPGPKYIAGKAFEGCKYLKFVEFQQEPDETSLLLKIDYNAFSECSRLRTFESPSSVESLGRSVFADCCSLMEVNLGTTSLKVIPFGAFQDCGRLLFAGMPVTLKVISEYAFYGCRLLVTLLVPPKSGPITLEEAVFGNCEQLLNVVLPQDSSAEEEIGRDFLLGSQDEEGSGSFLGCCQLFGHFGRESADIVTGLSGRFRNLPMHEYCYYLPYNQERCPSAIQRDQLVDRFGMTPLHVLFSKNQPSTANLEQILEIIGSSSDAKRILLQKTDGNEEKACDYLAHYWTPSTGVLLSTFFRYCVVGILETWHATSWVAEVTQKLDALSVLGGTKSDKGKGEAIIWQINNSFYEYGRKEALNILKMALWKLSIRSGWNADRSNRQALDREDCRLTSGSSVVVPLVEQFLRFLRKT